MKRKLRGIRRTDIQLDFNLYRVDVPIRGLAGAALSVIDIWPEGVEKTMMFVHGYAGCAETWEHQINYFSRRYRVVVPDLRGHGQSDAPMTQYTMPELVSDLHTIVETLGLPERFVLVGHSFGGSICVEYANAHPERLEKLVLIAAAGEYPLPRQAAWAFRIPTAILRPLWKYRPRWNAEIHVMKRMMLNNMRRWRGWPLLRSITTPTLVITGQRDSYFPRYVYDDLAKMIPGAEVVDVGSAKHKVQLERHRAVNRAIERFIEGRQQSSWRELETRAGHLTERRPWLAHYGPNIPLTVPIPRQPLHRFLESAADWAPRRTALVFYRIRYTYRQLNMLANQFAHTLHGMGVQPGDRVLLVLPNIPQLVVAYYATLKIGGVAVLPGPEMDVSLLTRQVQETRPKVLVALREAVDLVEAVRALDDPPQVVLTGIRQAAGEAVYRRLLARWGLAPDRAAPDSAGLSMAELMADASPLSPGITVRPDALAAVLYTSGTEGLPKGVKLTHANLVANTMQTRHWLQELEYGREVCLSVVPLTHSYGMTNAMNAPVALAATLVLLPGFELDEVLQHIKKYRPTLFPGVPAMYTAINQAPNVRSYGLHSIKACVSGAAPLPVEVQEAFEKLTRGRLVEGYGLTEASPVTHANPLYGVRKVGSIGVPIPNTDARIVDLTTGQDLPPGQIGELVVKGPQVMPGYWNDEPATRQVLRDGWLHTGDVAVMDAEGYFTIINRRQEIIEVDGQWVFPRDVEEVLYEHSKVLEAAAVGVTVEENGRPATRVRAFVVPRPGEHISPEELLALCRRRLEPHAVPREIVLREELPKSFVGKILRTKLGGD